MTILLRSLVMFNRLHYIMVLAALGLLLSTSLFAGNFSPFFFTAILLFIGFVIFVSQSGSNNSFSTRLFVFIFSCSIIITCLTFLYYSNIYELPYESGGTDDLAFETVAYTLMNSSVKTFQEAKDLVRIEGSGTWNASGYYTMVVAIIHLFIAKIGLQPHTLNPRLLNGFILALTSVTTYHVARYFCKSEPAARFAGYYSGLLPTVMFCAAHVYRDVIVGFGIISIVALSLVLIERFKSLLSFRSFIRLGIAIGLFIVCFLLAVSFREGFKVIIPTMIGLMIFSQIKSWRVRLCILIIVTLILTWAISVGLLDRLFDTAAFFTEYYTEYRSGQGAEQGFATGIYRLPFLPSIPIRILYASISPLPFPTEVVTESYRQLGTLLWFFSLPFLTKGLLCSIKPSSENKLRPLAVAFMCTYLLVALVTMQSRHITMFAPTGAILIALGIETSTQPVFNMLRKMLYVGISMVVVYIIMKKVV